MLDLGFRAVVDQIVALRPKSRQTRSSSAMPGGDAGRLAKQYTRDAGVREDGPVTRRTSRVHSCSHRASRKRVPRPVPRNICNSASPERA